MSNAFLSKSKYCLGLQCPKLLWFQHNAKNRIPGADQATQVLFDQGHEVGDLSKKLYPDGIEIGWNDDFNDAVRQTQALLKERRPLFEASFLANRAFARADILNPVGRDQWDIIEVKMTSAVKDIHCHDVAFQRFCYESAGIQIARCWLMHINSTYVRQGEIAPQQLLLAEDITATVEKYGALVGTKLATMLQTIAAPTCPEVEIGPHCDDPYSCPLKELCWEKVRAYDDNIFTLYRLGAKAWSFYQQGVLRTLQIPYDYPLSDTQLIQIDAERTGQPHIDRDAIRTFLERLQYPLYFLDFETFMTPIPMFEMARPYQQTPFQFSLHVLNSAGAQPQHYTWLWDGQGDPRAIVLKRLQAVIGNTGSVVAYNASFESRILREAAEVFAAQQGWVQKVTERIVDLLDPFRSFAVYYPAQHGTASIKSVLPALTGKSYQGMEIADGSTASAEFMRVMFRACDDQERSRVRSALDKYCALDTMAMVDVVRKLQALLH
jgi:hypothetical protein